MKRYSIIVVLAWVVITHAHAQNIDDILRSIEQNNKELQALQQSSDVAKMEVQTRNNLEDPSVEYSPFYSKGISGMATSELVVTQGFDFPTLYVARHQAGKLQQEALDKEHQVARRELLLTAKNLCLDLIRLNQEHSLLIERKKNADQLLDLFEKRLEEGDANILDVNKIKMERMNVQTEVARNQAEHRTALQQLLAMNGNLPLEFTADTYPAVLSVSNYSALYEEVMATDVSLQAADVAARAAKKEVNVSKQSWLPKLEVGYRRNTDLDEKFNGFLIGGSWPVFSNRKKTKIARAQAVSAQLLLDDARLKAEATLQGQFNEMQQLQEALAAYDVPLMKQSLGWLLEAVTAGQMSIIDFYVEADNIYKNLQGYMELENQYQKLVATVYKNRL